ncbi:MAG: DVU0298 family protein [Thermodesulfovibrionales bacterium]
MDFKYVPECPFCMRFISRPSEIRVEFGYIIGGRCLCGAVYVCDPTGKNLGEVFMDGLAYFFGSWDVENLESERDFFTVEMDYDLNKHCIISVKQEGHSSGKLLFINDKDVPKKREVKAMNMSSREMKSTLERLLNDMNYDEIAKMAAENSTVISKLISMSYDKESLLTWRAIDSLKEISRVLTPIDIGLMRNIVRKLLWSITDESGGIGWSACEMLGSIVSAYPEQYSDIIPIIWSFREEEIFRAGSLWAMAQIAMVDPSVSDMVCGDLMAMFNDKDSTVRGYAVFCQSVLKCNIDIKDISEKLSNDDGKLLFYDNGYLKEFTVSSLVKRFIYGLN